MGLFQARVHRWFSPSERPIFPRTASAPPGRTHRARVRIPPLAAELADFIQALQQRPGKEGREPRSHRLAAGICLFIHGRVGHLRFGWTG